ncbi:hypothetical protein KO566_13885 [Flavobacteriaceae bacterium XHP0103]|uniref:hypothetical protein n=1 Tax=Marixanthotalea marina TaxID=2844359 RepID=UPI002989CC50|nr:hypothetical protein [Marixanthotalea marina]MBU3823149.1 hypothetical protein [Marixanthotalea marina]
MNWIITIKTNSDFAINNGFNIIEADENGMFKSCRLKYGQVFDLEYYYEKGPVHADIIFDGKRMDLIHSANFVNGKKPKYEFPKFYWKKRTDSDAEYIKYYDQILSHELDKILEWIFKLNNQQWTEFKNYSGNENLRLTGL